MEMEERFLIKKQAIPALFEKLGKEMDVFVPCLNENKSSVFLPYKGQELYTGGRTDFSPKKIVLPPIEKEFFFRKESSSFKVEHILDSRKRLIFGVRACDTHAIKALDKLYLEYFQPDPWYRARREDTIIIALQCSTSCKNGFCQSIGTEKATGHDLLLFEKKDCFLIEPVSEKGRTFLKQNRQFFNRTNFAKPEIKFKSEKSLSVEGLKDALDSNFFHEEWAKESERCLSCTSCTQVCPSCYCFLSFDRFVLNTGSSERFRQWDSCQLQSFTKVAGNHVFRKSRKSRLRQFVMHKLSYFQENHKMPLCVGCGRCISVCPVGIDLTKIASAIREESK